jgi:hypothetical protein
VTGTSSLYFSPLVSLPFTPGHEIVATCSTTSTTCPPAPASSSTRC